jgi:hypothetical protein
MSTFHRPAPCIIALNKNMGKLVWEEHWWDRILYGHRSSRPGPDGGVDGVMVGQEMDGLEAMKSNR